MPVHIGKNVFEYLNSVFGIEGGVVIALTYELKEYITSK